MQTVILLLLAMAIPFPLCYFRMKKYGISLPKMLVIYLIVSTVGFVGARFGPSAVGIKDVGVKLYGLVLLDFIAIFPVSKILKIDKMEFGDFIAPPIMAVCASSKINCLINDCCRGMVICYNGSVPVYFPSVIVEMMIWFILVALLILVERKKQITGSLWPILMIWFGVVRFLVDFLRGSEWEKKPYFLTLSGGQFWSLVTLVIGVFFLVYAFHKHWKRYPTITEFLKTVFGVRLTKSEDGQDK